MTGALTDLLKATSRSFYLTLRVLPSAVRPQIGLAYLLARTTDTIADTEILPVEQRLEALDKLRARILGQSSTPLHFGEMAKQQGSPAERVLLEKVEDALAVLQTLSPDDLKLVREVLTTITSGQELDLRRFGGGSAAAPAASGSASLTETATTRNIEREARSTAPGAGALPQIIALQTAAELDDYTYRVAGCVGEFWTKICRAHLFPKARMDEKQFIMDGIRFGKGLQLVNILRDLPSDLKNHRCYLPLERLEAVNLRPETLLSPVNQQKFLPLFHEQLDTAEAHLAAGWRYTNTLPFGQFRVRLACAWPILIGTRTIEKLRGASGTDLQQRVKVSRGEVRGILFRSLLACPFPGIWRKLSSSTGKAVASRSDLA